MQLSKIFKCSLSRSLAPSLPFDLKCYINNKNCENNNIKKYFFTRNVTILSLTTNHSLTHTTQTHPQTHARTHITQRCSCAPTNTRERARRQHTPLKFTLWRQSSQIHPYSNCTQFVVELNTWKKYKPMFTLWRQSRQVHPYPNCTQFAVELNIWKNYKLN